MPPKKKQQGGLPLAEHQENNADDDKRAHAKNKANQQNEANNEEERILQQEKQAQAERFEENLLPIPKNMRGNVDNNKNINEGNNENNEIKNKEDEKQDSDHEEESKGKRKSAKDDKRKSKSNKRGHNNNDNNPRQKKPRQHNKSDSESSNSSEDEDDDASESSEEEKILEPLEKNFRNKSTKEIVQYWEMHPPKASDTFPAPPGGAQFLGAGYGFGQWKYREHAKTFWTSHTAFINAIFEYNYRRGVRKFKMMWDDVEWEVSFDHRGERQVNDFNKKHVLTRD